jgi:hypothetical protein
MGMLSKQCVRVYVCVYSICILNQKYFKAYFNEGTHLDSGCSGALKSGDQNARECATGCECTPESGPSVPCRCSKSVTTAVGICCDSVKGFVRRNSEPSDALPGLLGTDVDRSRLQTHMYACIHTYIHIYLRVHTYIRPYKRSRSKGWRMYGRASGCTVSIGCGGCTVFGYCAHTLCLRTSATPRTPKGWRCCTRRAADVTLPSPSRHRDAPGLFKHATNR